MKRTSIVVAVLLALVAAVAGGQTILPGGGRANPKRAWGIELADLTNSLQAGGFGIGASYEYAPDNSPRVGIKLRAAIQAWAPIDFLAALGATFAGISLPPELWSVNYDFMASLRGYPSLQALNTFYIGLGVGLLATQSSAFSHYGSNTFTVTAVDTRPPFVLQPQWMIESGYRYMLSPGRAGLYVESGINYKVILPPPGVDFYIDWFPAVTFLLGRGEVTLLNGFSVALSVGYLW